jgi:hypothetical protein
MFIEGKHDELIKNNIFDLINNLQSSFAKQIILSIYLFSQIKANRLDVANDMLNKYNFSFEETIFSYKFMEAKFYYLTVKLYLY